MLAIVVFSCIASLDLYKQGQCPLNEDSTACGFGIFIGVTAFLICLFFLLVDAKFDSFSNVKTRKRAVIVDLAISGELTLLKINTIEIKLLFHRIYNIVELFFFN